MKYFGVNIKENPANRINKESYLSAKPEGMSGWDEESYIRQIPRAALNYDMNMRYFEALDQDEFLKYVEKTREKYNMEECTDLNMIADVEGVYMIVLDNYKQMYIGQSCNMKKRIMKHWSNKKSLERLIFGNVCNSGLSIDSFGALDTTRIFYIATNDVFMLEEYIVRELDVRFSLNRTAGGIGSSETYTDTAGTIAAAVIANMREKELYHYVSREELQKAVSKSEYKECLRRYPI